MSTPAFGRAIADQPSISSKKIGGEGEIRTHVPELPDHPISSRRRYDHFGTSPVNLKILPVYLSNSTVNLKKLVLRSLATRPETHLSRVRRKKYSFILPHRKRARFKNRTCPAPRTQMDSQ